MLSRMSIVSFIWQHASLKRKHVACSVHLVGRLLCSVSKKVIATEARQRSSGMKCCDQQATILEDIFWQDFSLGSTVLHAAGLIPLSGLVCCKSFGVVGQ